MVIIIIRIVSGDKLMKVKVKGAKILNLVEIKPKVGMHMARLTQFTLCTKGNEYPNLMVILFQD